MSLGIEVGGPGSRRKPESSESPVLASDLEAVLLLESVCVLIMVQICHVFYLVED